MECCSSTPTLQLRCIQQPALVGPDNPHSPSRRSMASPGRLILSCLCYAILPRIRETVKDKGNDSHIYLSCSEKGKHEDK
jgi:hypothetical protein